MSLSSMILQRTRMTEHFPWPDRSAFLHTIALMSLSFFLILVQTPWFDTNLVQLDPEKDEQA